jgi:hypothetical protein
MMQFLCGAAEEVENSFMELFLHKSCQEFGVKIMLGI